MITTNYLKNYAKNIVDGKRGYSIRKVAELAPSYLPALLIIINNITYNRTKEVVDNLLYTKLGLLRSVQSRAETIIDYYHKLRKQREYYKTNLLPYLSSLGAIYKIAENEKTAGQIMTDAIGDLADISKMSFDISESKSILSSMVRLSKIADRGLQISKDTIEIIAKLQISEGNLSQKEIDFMYEVIDKTRDIT